MENVIERITSEYDTWIISEFLRHAQNDVRLQLQSEDIPRV